jgi:serine/threonine protein kinase
MQQYYVQEADIMREVAKIDCPHLVKAISFYDESQFFVLPRFEGDLLNMFVDPPTFDELTVADRKQMVTDIADAIIALHDAGLSHRDIKPDNIFHSIGRAYLGDFGLASPSFKVIYGVHPNSGSPAWLAPEVEKIVTLDEGNNGYETAPTDMWSFGLVAYLIITGLPLYTDHEKRVDNRNHVIRCIHSRGWPTVWAHSEKFIKKLSAEEKELVEACLCIDPTKRVSAATLKTLSYFS